MVVSSLQDILEPVIRSDLQSRISPQKILDCTFSPVERILRLDQM